MDRSSQNSGTIAVRNAHRFDAGALEIWLGRNVQGYSGPLRVEQFKGGQSNPTYKLITPERCYVLRRKPPGKLLPGAHAVDREYRVIEALGAQGFPVAGAYGLCLEEDVIGTPFYVMEMVEGRIFWEAHLPQLSREERPAYFDAMNAAMAQLHRIDPAAAGLADYGKPGNYFERQIGRWSKQYLGDEQAGRVEAMDRLVEWLPANIPPGEDEARIIHGDFRCDNMIFHATEPRVLAVLDWELSTLGHPLADFSYHLMMYRMPAHITTGLAGPRPRGAQHPHRGGLCRRLLPPHRPGRHRRSRFLYRLQPVPPLGDRPRHQGPHRPRHRRLRPCRQDGREPRRPGGARLVAGEERGRALDRVSLMLKHRSGEVIPAQQNRP
jgi:aminoglycoside phosphotransferase (APT) family kinase protein